SPFWPPLTVRRTPYPHPHRSLALAGRGADRAHPVRFCRAPLELLPHPLTRRGLEYHAIATADRGSRRHDDESALMISRRHRLARNLQRVGVLVVNGRKSNLIPAPTGWNAGLVEIAVFAGLCQPDQRDRFLDLRAAALLDHLH